VANEVVGKARWKKRKKCAIEKVDFEKAYDSVSWNFILYVAKIETVRNG